MNEIRKNEKSLRPLAVGFFLIMLAATLILTRQQSDRKKTETSSEMPDANGQIAKSKQISSSELASRILNENSLIILDMRSQDEFDQEHIRNSKNARPADLANLENGRLYVIVADGLSAEETDLVEKTFERSGIKDYFFLSGGFSAWKSGYNPTVSAGNPNSPVDQAKVTYVASEELKAKMDTERNLLIVDLRNKEKFAEGHLKGAVNIPLDDLERERNRIPLGKKAALYSEGAEEAFRGAVRLYDLGIFNALALSDGFEEWQKKGFEVVK
jgi:rhodanese-related sulfurtransferase